MACSHCCGAEKLFDLKTALKEKKKYNKKGPKGSTKRLVYFLNNYPVTGKKMLDIGGGIGALQWAFLERGGLSTTDVDASPAYINVAEEIAREKQWQHQTSFLTGDITTFREELSPHDFVTLDKVVCCYPSYHELLSVATTNCREILALTMPVSNVFARLFASIGNLLLYLKKNPFRTYIHSKKEIDQFIRDKGFYPEHQKLSFPWHVMVYRRR